MSKRKTVITGIVANALLFAGGLAFLDWITREPEPARRPERASEAPPAESPQALPPPDDRLAGFPQGLPPPDPGQAVQPPPEFYQPPPPPSAPPGPRRVDLLTSLNQVRGRILECAGLLPKVDTGDDDPGSRRAADAARRAAPKLRAYWQLDLEPGQGEMTVHEATLQDRGAANEVVLECAQLELKGQVLDAAAARPGPRVKMRFGLDR